MKMRWKHCRNSRQRKRYRGPLIAAAGSARGKTHPSMKRTNKKSLSVKPFIQRRTDVHAPRLLVVGNWKMNLTMHRSAALANAFARVVVPGSIDAAVCPDYTALSTVIERLDSSRISVGAQDVSWGRPGALTGEVSAENLVAIGCRYVIIGHSERRRECYETDRMVQQKIFVAMGHGLSPILCVGESRDERRRRGQFHVVSQQVHRALHNVPPPRHRQELVVAYEPIWAISPGGPASPADALEMAHVIHQALVDTYGERIARTATRVLYGGSVDARNVRDFADGETVQGVLVGRDSLNASSFSAILKALA